jgi:uncharacterized protein (DUF362 family)
MAANRLNITRRAFGPLGAALALPSCSEPPQVQSPPGNAAVFITRAASYAVELASKIEEGVKACGLEVRGKRVLLKPNLVEYAEHTAINTNVAVIAAALEVFRKLGAASVRIGEGPGHRRDTIDLTELTGYRQSIAGFDDLFVDLNRDDVGLVRGFAGKPEFFFSKTVLGADLIVSVAKMKTHHWAGATLSMKNLFGLVPSAIYGWPKNTLHRIGVENSILALNRQFRNTFAIVDGIVGMEGNGPIQGTPKVAGVLVMGRDVVAVDATCCRIMGINPRKVKYLDGGRDLGHLEAGRIEQRGESIGAVATAFALMEEHRHLRLEAGDQG